MALTGALQLCLLGLSFFSQIQSKDILLKPLISEGIVLPHRGTQEPKPATGAVVWSAPNAINKLLQSALPFETSSGSHSHCAQQAALANAGVLC